MIEEYLVGFSAIITFHVKMTHIKKIQTNIRTFIIGKNFKMLRKKIVLVQKCIR